MALYRPSHHMQGYEEIAKSVGVVTTPRSRTVRCADTKTPGSFRWSIATGLLDSPLR
jgi:hypothetical protein